MFEGNLDVEASSVITSWKGVEGDLYLMEAGPDARRYFVKHTRITSYEDKDNEGDYPNEAKMLFGKIGPHPRIVRLFRCSPDPDDRTRWFLKMEFCAGGDLGSQYEHWLYRLRSGMPEVFLLHFIVSAVEALAFLHHGLRYAGNGRWTQDAAYESIIHGDLKEGNFFLRWTPIPIGGLPEVVLGDFGTAKIAGRRNAKTNIGTLCFGSPEDVAIYGTAIPSPATRQIFQTAVNARTVAHDMYSLGLMVYMFATRSRDPTAIGTDPATLRISREYETPGIVTLLQKMLVVDPATRARASFHAVHGVLPAVDALRDARDRIIADRRVLDRMEFSSPPAMPTRFVD
jgi:NIMA (never in mitosis gene a)-related kinase